VIEQIQMAFRVVGMAFRDVWQELWTILIVHLLFLLGTILIVTGPPVTLALFFYGNRIAHGEVANERDFLAAVRQYWRPAWRWGFVNLIVVGLLVGDYSLIGRMNIDPNAMHFIQGLYVTLLVFWSLLQLFALPFLFEQNQPVVLQALRNAMVFIRRNLFFVCTLALLLIISLTLGTLAFMLTFAFGGAFLAFAGNHAVLEHLTEK
jgi:hypothetical protein